MNRNLDDRTNDDSSNADGKQNIKPN